MPERESSPELPAELVTLRAILEKIITYQRSIREDRPVELGELESEGILNASDLDFMRSHSVTYDAGKQDRKGIRLSMPRTASEVEGAANRGTASTGQSGPKEAEALGPRMGVSVQTIETYSRVLDPITSRQLLFIRQCLNAAPKSTAPEGGIHVTAETLLSTAAKVARKMYGNEAPEKLRLIGITSSLTLGEAVFRLVELKLLTRREEDRIEGFNVASAFDRLFEA